MSRSPLACAWAALVLLGVIGCTAEPPQFTRHEFTAFLADADRINSDLHVLATQLARTNNAPLALETIQTTAHNAIRMAGWELGRFYYIYGHCVDYAAFERQRAAMERTDTVLLKAAKRDGSALSELKTSRRRHAYVLSLLKENLDEKIPISEQVVLHEYRRQVLKLVTDPAIPFSP